MEAQTIDASRYPSLQTAIDAAPEHGIVQMPAGVYRAASLIIRKNVSLVGAGVERTFLISPAGWSQAVIKYAPAAVASSVEISGFTVSLQDARSATALELHNL